MTRTKAHVVAKAITSMLSDGNGEGESYIVTAGWVDDGTKPDDAKDWFVRVDSVPTRAREREGTEDAPNR